MADLLARLQSALADRYTIERELGGGGVVRVFLAEELARGRRLVAVACRHGALLASIEERRSCDVPT